VKPVNRSVYGIDEVDAPMTGSAMVEYSFGLPPEPLTNTPATAGKDPHDVLRTLDSAQEQSFRFFKDGVVAPFCSGPCAGPDLAGPN